MQTLYLCLGDTQMMLERLDDARKSYDEAYQWVLRTPNDSTCRPIAASIETLENISSSQLNHHLDEAGVWVDRMDSLVTLYEKEPKVIEKEVKTLRALVFLHRARFLQMRGQSKEAGRINGCDYLMAANRYGEAADIYTNLDQFIKEWGYDYDLETIRQNLLPKFRANYLSGRQDSALRVAMQIAEVYDTALVRQKRSESAELATIYDTQGKERKILEQRAENRLVTAISIAVTVLALLILAFAVYIFYQWRFTKRKNRVLVDQINEVLEYKKKYRELKQKTQAQQTHQQTHPQPLPEREGSGHTPDGGEAEGLSTPLPLREGQGGGSALSISDMTELTDEQLFLCLRDLIENEQLFLNSCS